MAQVDISAMCLADFASLKQSTDIVSVIGIIAGANTTWMIRG